MTIRKADRLARPAAESGGEELEITPEMIAAGMEAISGFELLDAWEGHLGKAELVQSILHRALSRRLHKSV